MSIPYMSLDWILNQSLDQFKRRLVFARQMPPVVRVRRRGFPREVRRGFDVRYQDGIYRVVRRSNWNLWLEKLPEPTQGSGSTVSVRRPDTFTS